MLSIQVKKAGRAFDVPALVPVEGQPGVFRVDGNIVESGVLHVWEYGWKQLASDATVQAGKPPAALMASELVADTTGEAQAAYDKKLVAYAAECEAFALKRIENVCSGATRTRTVKPADRIEAEALRMATAMVKAHPKLKDASPAKIKEMAAKYAPSYLDRAKAAIAELDALNAEIDIDLG